MTPDDRAAKPQRPMLPRILLTVAEGWMPRDGHPSLEMMQKRAEGFYDEIGVGNVYLMQFTTEELKAEIARRERLTSV